MEDKKFKIYYCKENLYLKDITIKVGDCDSYQELKDIINDYVINELGLELFYLRWIISYDETYLIIDYGSYTHFFRVYGEIENLRKVFEV